MLGLPLSTYTLHSDVTYYFYPNVTVPTITGTINKWITIADTVQADAVTGDGTTIKAAYNQNVTIARNDSAIVYAFIDGELTTASDPDFIQFDGDDNLRLSATGGDVYYFTIGLSEALTADEYLALDSDLALGYEYGGQTVESLILPLLFIAVVIALFAVTLGLLSTGFKRSQ